MSAVIAIEAASQLAFAASIFAAPAYHHDAIA